MLGRDIRGVCNTRMGFVASANPLVVPPFPVVVRVAIQRNDGRERLFSRCYRMHRIRLDQLRVSPVGVLHHLPVEPIVDDAGQRRLRRRLLCQPQRQQGLPQHLTDGCEVFVV